MAEYSSIYLVTAAVVACLHVIAWLNTTGGTTNQRAILTGSALASLVATGLLIASAGTASQTSVVCLIGLQLTAIGVTTWILNMNLWTMIMRLGFLVHIGVVCVGYILPLL